MRPLGLVGRSWRRGGDGDEGRAGDAIEGDEGSDDLRARRAALASFSSRDGMAFSSVDVENDAFSHPTSGARCAARTYRRRGKALASATGSISFRRSIAQVHLCMKPVRMLVRPGTEGW